MNLQQSPTIDIERPGVRNESETRLPGRWLLIARAGWVVLALLVLTLNAISIPRADALLQAVCQPGAVCISGLTPAEVSQLQQSGLSPGFLAAYQIGWDVVTTLIYTALAALIFWRRSADRMALFCAYRLVLFGGATYTSLLDLGLRTLAPVWYWLVGGLELLAQVCVPTFFLLFPSGRFVPRWTRWGVLVVVLYEGWYVFFSNAYVGQGSALFSLSFAVLILGLVGLQVYRYRRVSTFRERQQTRWVVFGLAVALGGFALFLISVSLFLPPELRNLPLARVLIPTTVVEGLLLFIASLWAADCTVGSGLRGPGAWAASPAGWAAPPDQRYRARHLDPRHLRTVPALTPPSSTDHRPALLPPQIRCGSHVGGFQCDTAQRGRLEPVERAVSGGGAGDDAAGACLPVVAFTSTPWKPSGPMESHSFCSLRG